MSKKVSEETWSAAMSSLMQRRANTGYNLKNPKSDPIGDYEKHMTKCNIGRSVLDVGCGHMVIKEFLPEGIAYTGIDPFPCVPEAVEMKIESCDYPDASFDTVVCFAVLDGLNDFDKAMQNIKRIAAKNVFILTGVNIPVDKYHTFELTERDIDNALSGMKKTYREAFNPKVLLLEYSK